jgi:hypothetical protein
LTSLLRTRFKSVIDKFPYNAVDNGQRKVVIDEELPDTFHFDVEYVPIAANCVSAV